MDAWIVNLLTGVLGSLLAAILTYVATVTYHFRLPSPAKLLLRRKLRGGVTVALSERITPESVTVTQGRSPSWVPLPEALAFHEIRELLERELDLGATLCSVQSVSDYEAIATGNLVAIGGGKYNLMARQLIGDLLGKIHYTTLRSLNPSPRTGVSDAELKTFKALTADLDDLQIEHEDRTVFGTVILARNPNADGNWVLIMYGHTPVATRACAHWLLGLTWLKYLQFFGELRGPFQAVFSVRATSQSEFSNMHTIMVRKLKGE